MKFAIFFWWFILNVFWLSFKKFPVNSGKKEFKLYSPKIQLDLTYIFSHRLFLHLHPKVFTKWHDFRFTRNFVGLLLGTPSALWVIRFLIQCMHIRCCPKNIWPNYLFKHTNSTNWKGHDSQVKQLKGHIDYYAMLQLIGNYFLS